jgi:hypothetical protein
MQVGVNYPWVNYGWDFGPAPPSWGRAPGADPAWLAEVDAHLARFVGLGLRVVRWFILADGLAYGTGADAPRRDDRGRWRFDPPPLDPEACRHFGLLLERLEAANPGTAPRITLLPVLVDYGFFEPGRYPVPRPAASPGTSDPGWVKGGRAEAVNDVTRRRAFLEGALGPLLRIARPHARLIHAWEIVNEPEWVTRGWHPRSPGGLPVEEGAMHAFVLEASAAIRAAGFSPTVGFARGETIARARLGGGTSQLHHYAGGRRRLQAPDPARPAILGELATATASDPWPDLSAHSQGLFERLELAERQGYPLALLWSALPLVSPDSDRHSRWDAEVEREITRFTRGTAGEHVT